MSTAIVGAISLHSNDDVAVMTGDGQAGQDCTVRTVQGNQSLALSTDVPFGHKVALKDLSKGSEVHKYGQPIGIALENITVGSHVHIHNMSGLRSNLRGEKK